MEKQQSVKKRLVSAAERLFYQNGYNRTGINEIISAANVAKASLYANFSSKDDLLVAYLNSKEVTFTNNLYSFVEKRVRGWDRVICLLDFLLEMDKQKDFRGSWWVNTLAEVDKDNHRLRKEIAANKDRFRAYVKNLVKDNIDTTNAHSISNKIYVLFEGALTESYLHNAPWPIVEAKDTVKLLV